MQPEENHLPASRHLAALLTIIVCAHVSFAQAQEPLPRKPEPPASARQPSTNSRVGGAYYSYDASTDESRVGILPPVVWRSGDEKMYLSVGFTVAGTTLVAPQEIEFHLAYTAARALIPEGAVLTVTSGSRRFRYPVALLRKPHFRESKVYEIATFAVPFEEFAAMARESAVTAEVVGLKFDLARQTLGAFTDIIKIAEARLDTALPSSTSLQPDHGDVPIRAVGKAQIYSYPFENKMAVSTLDVEFWLRPNDTLQVMMSFDVEGRKVVAPEHVQFAFVSQTLNGRLTGADTLAFQLNGETRVYKPQHPVGIRPLDGLRAEFVSYDVPWTDVLKLAAATKIEMRLGGMRVTVPSNVIQALRDLRRAVEESN